MTFYYFYFLSLKLPDKSTNDATGDELKYDVYGVVWKEWLKEKNSD